MQIKSVAKNALFNVLYKFVNLLFPLVTSIYISHILQATGVGKVGIAQNLAQYFILLAPMGLLNYGTREIAIVRDCESNTNKLFSEFFFLNLISTAICVATYYTLVLTTSYCSEERLLFVVAGIPIVLNCINIEWYYQGMEEFVYISIRSIIVKVLSLVALLLFVKTTDDYVVYALIYSLGIAGNYFFNIIRLIRSNIRIQIHNLNIRIHLKSIFILLASTIAIELYTLIDTTMLGIMCDEQTVGYYTNAIKLDRIVVGLIAAIGAVLLPRFSYYREKGMLKECSSLLSKVIMVMIFFSIPCATGVFILSDRIVPVLFGNTFIPAILTVKIGTCLILILALSNLFGTQVLVTFNQERKLLLCTICGAGSNFFLNLLFIPIFQHNGAVVASVLSELLVFIMSFVMARKYIKMSVPISFWLKTILSGLIMAAIVCIFSTYILNRLNNLINIIISILIAMIAYAIASIILKNPVSYELKNMIRRKYKNV